MAHLITIAGGFSNVALPNGLRYDAGAQVPLSDAEYSLLSANFKAVYLSADVVQGGSGGGITVFSLTDGATITIDASKGNDQRVTIAGNRALANPVNPVDGMTLTLTVQQDSSGSRTLSYGSAFSFSTSLPQPTLTTTPSYYDILSFKYYASTGKWRFTGFVNGFSA